MNAPLSPEELPPEFVVTKDPHGIGYWVRKNDGSCYWPNHGYYFWKRSAIRRAKELSGASRLVNREEVVVWSSR